MTPFKDSREQLRDLAGAATQAFEESIDAEAKLDSAVDEVADILGDLGRTSCTYQGYWIGWEVDDVGDLAGPFMREADSIQLD